MCNRILPSIGILARLCEIQNDTAEALRTLVRGLLASGRKSSEVIFDDGAADFAPVVRGIPRPRIALRGSTLYFHDGDDAAVSEHILSGMETLNVLRAVENITVLLDDGVLVLDGGVIRRAGK